MTAVCLNIFRFNRKEKIAQNCIFDSIAETGKTEQEKIFSSLKLVIYIFGFKFVSWNALGSVFLTLDVVVAHIYVDKVNLFETIYL